ncbi:MAG: hypothetical protein AAF682_32740 [Planctomycetota bacterium]
MHKRIWLLAKLLQGLGMILVLVGVILSMRLGFQDQALESMQYEMNGLLGGGGLFLVGWLLERWSGGR